MNKEGWLYFEGRDLKPYVEPVSSEQLQEGTIYFAVNYVDREMLIPTMETLVFVGRNLESGDKGRVFFQDVRSYRKGVKYDWEATDAIGTFYSGSENQIGHIFEFEQALDNLLRCLLRRRKMHKWIPLHFEGRELSSQAEPVSAESLEEGSVYFSLNYLDQEMHIPVIETLAFVGRNVNSDRIATVHFQDVESYREGIPYGLSSEADQATFHSSPEKELSSVFTFECVLDELMRCSLRRRNTGT